MSGYRLTENVALPADYWLQSPHTPLSCGLINAMISCLVLLTERHYAGESEAFQLFGGLSEGRSEADSLFSSPNRGRPVSTEQREVQLYFSLEACHQLDVLPCQFPFHNL